MHVPHCAVQEKKDLTSIRWIMDDIRPDMGTREQYMKNRAVMIRLQGL
jgi:hypothetical protein